MKINTLTVIVAAGLLAAGTAFAGNGQGYGGPPRSANERAARQGDCVDRNGGICPQGGPRGECPGNGQGNQRRRGARDGSGPRGGTGACPANPGTAQR
jgi:hypothetical protein